MTAGALSGPRLCQPDGRGPHPSKRPRQCPEHTHRRCMHLPELPCPQCGGRGVPSPQRARHIRQPFPSSQLLSCPSSHGSGFHQAVPASRNAHAARPFAAMDMRRLARCYLACAAATETKSVRVLIIGAGVLGPVLILSSSPCGRFRVGRPEAPRRRRVRRRLPRSLPRRRGRQAPCNA